MVIGDLSGEAHCRSSSRWLEKIELGEDTKAHFFKEDSGDR